MDVFARLSRNVVVSVPLFRAEVSLALNKRKILEAARKYAQKGAKAKALKEYNKLLKADARDAKLLLEVGDAYRRWGQNEEAIAQYGKVADQYRQDGFDARAVAVWWRCVAFVVVSVCCVECGGVDLLRRV